MKRFYREAEAGPHESGFVVLLDGRPVKTPARHDLAVPSPALARALAAEWAAQEDEIRPATMRLTRLASTALDRVADARDAVAAEIARYAETDLLCYRAADPRDLVARETALWQPLLDWASLRYDAPLRVATGILPVAQPPHSLKALRTVVGSLGVLDLTAVADLTQTTGSLILALAVADGRIDAEAACAASLLDERFQAELWGEDVEALHRRRGVEADINAAARFLELLRD